MSSKKAQQVFHSFFNSSSPAASSPSVRGTADVFSQGAASSGDEQWQDPVAKELLDIEEVATDQRRVQDPDRGTVTYGSDFELKKKGGAWPADLSSNFLAKYVNGEATQELVCILCSQTVKCDVSKAGHSSNPLKHFNTKHKFFLHGRCCFLNSGLVILVSGPRPFWLPPGPTQRLPRVLNQECTVRLPSL